MCGPGDCPILRLRGFHFPGLPILAQPASDPFPFIQWSSTTEILNRDQPPTRMKAGLCEAMNTGCSDLLSIGLVKVKGKLSLAETNRLLISVTPSIESLPKIAGPQESVWWFACPPSHRQPLSDNSILLRHSSSQWGHLTFTSISLGGTL